MAHSDVVLSYMGIKAEKAHIIKLEAGFNLLFAFYA